MRLVNYKGSRNKNIKKEKADKIREDTEHSTLTTLTLIQNAKRTFKSLHSPQILMNEINCGFVFRCLFVNARESERPNRKGNTYTPNTNNNV